MVGKRLRLSSSRSKTVKRDLWVAVGGSALLTTGLLYMDLAGFEQFTVIVATIVAGICFYGLWVGIEFWHHFHRIGIRACRAIIGLGFALSFGIGWLRPGLRVTVLLAAPTLDRLADSLERGEKVNGPFRVGLLRFTSGEMRYESYPMLVLSPDPSGKIGLVRAQHEPGNAWSCVQAGQGWMLFSED